MLDRSNVDRVASGIETPHVGRSVMRRVAKITAAVVLGLSSHAMAAPSQAQATANQALNRLLPEVKFQGQTLKDCIDFLRDISGANLHVNWRALEAAGVGADT